MAGPGRPGRRAAAGTGGFQPSLRVKLGDYEVGKRYRAALAHANVEVRLVPTTGSVENRALLVDPHSGVSVGLIEGGISKTSDISGLESLSSLTRLLNEAARVHHAARRRDGVAVRRSSA
jgi:hypothetical protein